MMVRALCLQDDLGILTWNVPIDLSVNKFSVEPLGDVHCGKLISGVTVTCNPNLINAPRMIPAGIATYYTFWVL